MEGAREKMKAIMPVAHLVVALVLFFTSMSMVTPFLVDVYLGAVCEGGTECSQMMLLLGAQQLIVGLGIVVLAPVLGTISDDYGRKPVFKIVLFLAVLPSVILAYRRTQVLVYIWLSLAWVMAILKDGALVPAALAYVADVVDERHRATAIGLTIATISAGTLAGTALAYFFKVNFHDFWTAAGLQILAAIYLQLFVKESNPRVLLLPADLSQAKLTAKLISKPAWTRQPFTILETAKAVWRSPRLRTLALVDFMNNFALSGINTFLLYFLKAAFDFGKDEYAVIVIIWSVAAVVGQTLIYPVMANIFGERGVLSIALVGSAGQYFLCSFAWARWVPYLAAAAGIFPSSFQPAVGTMVSRGLQHDQQGKIQGFMGGVRAIAIITAPFVLTPLTVISLVTNAPLHMPGLIFFVCGVAFLVAWLISLRVPAWPLKSTESIEQPLLPDDNIDVQAIPQDVLQETINRIP